MSSRTMSKSAFDATRGELLKFRRLSFLLSVFGSLGVLTLLIVGFAWSRAEKHSSSMNLTTGFDMALFFLGILTLCICASYTAQEYTYGTLRNVLVLTPSRQAFLIGKLSALSALIFFLTLYTFLVSSVVSLFMSGRHGVNLIPSLEGKALLTTLAHCLNGFLGTMALGIFGIALGLITRSPIIAISLGLLWSLIIESALGGALPRIGRWLPTANFESLAQSGATGFTYIHCLGLSAFYLLLISLPALYLFKQRDVSQ